jgi:hypothetical protein
MAGCLGRNSQLPGDSGLSTLSATHSQAVASERAERCFGALSDICMQLSDRLPARKHLSVSVGLPFPSEGLLQPVDPERDDTGQVQLPVDSRATLCAEANQLGLAPSNMRLLP